VLTVFAFNVFSTNRRNLLPISNTIEINMLIEASLLSFSVFSFHLIKFTIFKIFPHFSDLVQSLLFLLLLKLIPFSLSLSKDGVPLSSFFIFERVFHADLAYYKKQIISYHS